MDALPYRTPSEQARSRGYVFLYNAFLTPIEGVNIFNTAPGIGLSVAK